MSHLSASGFPYSHSTLDTNTDADYNGRYELPLIRNKYDGSNPHYEYAHQPTGPDNPHRDWNTAADHFDDDKNFVRPPTTQYNELNHSMALPLLREPQAPQLQQYEREQLALLRQHYYQEYPPPHCHTEVGCPDCMQYTSDVGTQQLPTTCQHCDKNLWTHSTDNEDQPRLLPGEYYHQDGWWSGPHRYCSLAALRINAGGTVLQETTDPEQDRYYTQPTLTIDYHMPPKEILVPCRHCRYKTPLSQILREPHKVTCGQTNMSETPKHLLPALITSNLRLQTITFPPDTDHPSSQLTGNYVQEIADYDPTEHPGCGQHLLSTTYDLGYITRYITEAKLQHHEQLELQKTKETKLAVWKADIDYATTWDVVYHSDGIKRTDYKRVQRNGQITSQHKQKRPTTPR